jgi:predicted protein tyrosine phosphatase
MIPEFVVLSREDAERYQPGEREICVSIADPDAEAARISSRFVAVIRLHFTDVIEQGDPSDILFSADDARAISEFIDAWPDAARVVVHCNAGVSRSPGVALGLSDLRGWPTAKLERSHPGWNRLVRTSFAATQRQPAKRPPRRSK